MEYNVGPEPSGALASLLANEEIRMKTFCFGIACAAMMAFPLTLAGCGESGDKGSLKTKVETKSATEARSTEGAKVVADEQPARSEETQPKETQAATDRPPAETMKISLKNILG